MFSNFEKTKYFSRIFRFGMLWRIIYGCLKLIFGLILLKFIHSSFADLFYRIMNHELLEDPNDILIKAAGFILNRKSVDISYFAASYFIFWGSIDVFLSVNLLRFKIWAFPVSIALISLFTAYEIYRFFNTHSIILFFVILIDLFIIWLISKEYNKLKKGEKFGIDTVN